MTIYSYAQLEQLWINAGGPKMLAPLAAAIGEAESGGNSQAVNPYDNGGTQTSWGLWQISNGTHQPPVPNILNPAVNAQQAVGKWRGAGNSFSPWGTYDSGAYKQFMNGSTTPDKNVPGATGTSTDTSGQGTADCAWSLGGQHIGIVFGHGPSLPSTCVIKKTEVRAFIGATLIGVGFLMALPGLVIVAVYGFKASGAAKVVLDVAGVVPGYGRAARAASTAGRATERAAPRTGASRAAGASREDREIYRQQNPTRLRRLPERSEPRPASEIGRPREFHHE